MMAPLAMMAGRQATGNGLIRIIAWRARDHPMIDVSRKQMCGGITTDGVRVSSEHHHPVGQLSNGMIVTPGHVFCTVGS